MSKSAHVSIIACMSVNTDPVQWFQEDFLAYLIVLEKHATNSMIPTEVKVTPIILLKPRRQLLAFCTSQSFDTRVTEQKHLLMYITVETASTTPPMLTSSLFIIYFIVKM